jgi:hypothetical protein
VTTLAFESDLRHVLQERAPADVPRSLAAAVERLPALNSRRTGWVHGVVRVSAQAGFISLVLLLVAVIGLTTTRVPAPISPAAAPAFAWRTQMASLTAASMKVEVGGHEFVAPNDAIVISDPGTATYRTLEFMWHDGDIEMRVNLYLAANATSWWISQVRTYDGSAKGDWVYYLPPLFQAPLGEPFQGTADLVGIGTGGIGRLRLQDASITAFEAGTVPPAFADCRAIGPNGGGPQPMDLAETAMRDLGITPGMKASDAGRLLDEQGICHVFRLEFPALNQGQIWCSPPPGDVREYRFGTAGEVLVFVEDPARRGLDDLPTQVVGC